MINRKPAKQRESKGKTKVKVFKGKIYTLKNIEITSKVSL
jgi:hypothetical protein